MKSRFVFILLSLSIIGSCKKDPGPGGTATIHGKVYAHHIVSGGAGIDTSYYDPDDRIYIIYGNSSNTYDDDSRTSFDGSYKFQYLQKGTYRIYCYSKDTTGLANFTFDHTRPPVAQIVTVNVSEGQTVEAPEITVYLYN